MQTYSSHGGEKWWWIRFLANPLKKIENDDLPEPHHEQSDVLINVASGKEATSKICSDFWGMFLLAFAKLVCKTRLLRSMYSLFMAIQGEPHNANLQLGDDGAK